MEKKFKKILIFIIILIIWQILSKLNIWSDYILPSPGRVLLTAREMILDGSIFIDTLISIKRVLIGFSISFILSILFASLFIIHPETSIYFEGIFGFIKNVPPLSLVPILILWVGIGEGTKIVIIILASFFPLFLNIQKGFMVVDPNLLEVGDIFGYNKYEKFLKISLPSALKDIFVGMRIALGYSFRAIIAAEMIAASSGLGYMINFARQMSRIDKVIVGIIMIGFVGYLTDFIFVKLASKCLKGDSLNEWYNS